MVKYLKIYFSIFVLFTLFSCNLSNLNDLDVSGTVIYYASSPDFTYADNIRFKDVNGSWQNTGKISLPFKYSYYLNNINTFNLDPAEFYVQISSLSNTNGGTLYTSCSFSQNLRNTNYSISYLPGITISQYSWARIYPNTF